MGVLLAILVFVAGVSVGLFIAYLRKKNIAAIGEFVIRMDNEGRYSYTLKLEEEPEGLHLRRYILLRVTKSH